ncbi:MAG TPA: UDP-3-O-(3-hydroxymyristoyl)glucosamine N-acyltransferase, partial [Isosphaeraceae bacterium]
VGAQAGVHRSVPAGQHVLGSPAIGLREQRRIFQMIARLPEMHRQLRELAAQVAVLASTPHAIDDHGEHDDPTGF